MDRKTLSPVERFWLMLKPDKKEIRNVYIYALFSGLVNLSLPIGIQAIINLIQGGQMSTSWVILVFFVILGVAISGILQLNQLRISEYLQQKIFTRAAFEFAYRIPKIKLEALYKHYAPELMNRFFDVVSVQKGLSKILIDFSTASIQTVFGLLLLSIYHPFFILYSLVLVFLVFIIFKVTVRRGLDTSLSESKRKYEVAHWLQELARTAVSFKLAGTTELPMERTNESVGNYISSRDNHFKILVRQYSWLILFKILVAAGLLVIGSVLVMEDKMNIGQFVAAEIIILLVINSVEKLILSLETIYDVLTSLEKVAQVTDLELDSIEGININESILEEGLEVEIDKVDFHYPDQEKMLINQASMSISPGEKVMIYGPSDSGKTSLLYLLAGIYEVKGGNVLFNRLPKNNLNPDYLRSIIGDCLMDELLFEGTILENITMGREKATFENVQWAVESLGLNQFIKSLPKGYETPIRAQGKQFSKGLIDKLILARSIADKPKLLLVKDVFSLLGEEERGEILRFLTNKSNSWTLVIASRDKKISSMVDKVFELNKGCLKEIDNSYAEYFKK